MKLKKFLLTFLLLLFAFSVNAQNSDKKTPNPTQQPNQPGPWWGNTNSKFRLAGFAFVNYDQPIENGDTSAVDVGFTPIFHYAYKDIAMVEAEVEMEVGEDGKSKVALGYGVIDLFINDYMTLVGGRFLSPLGFFRQNIHPAWINRLPTAPAGFGHDGAAPVTETGLELCCLCRQRPDFRY